MKVLYDEAAAIKEKTERDVAVPKMNCWAIINNTFLVLLAVCFGVGVWFLVDHLSKNLLGIGSVSEDSLGLIITDTYIAVFAGFAFTMLIHKSVLPLGWKPIIFVTERYSANAEYYRITKDMNILQHKIVYQNGVYLLSMDLENADHEVSCKTLYWHPLKKKVRTDISETTIDLINGVIYEPFEGMRCYF